MTNDRRARLLGLLGPLDSPMPLGVRIAGAAREVLGAVHIGITVTTDGVPTPLDCGDDVGALLDEQQANLGDGPTVAATRSSTAVITPNVGSPQAAALWPLFTPVAVRLRVRSVVALPLRFGAARLGVLSAYRTQAGGLDDEQYADALVLAALATELLVAEQAGLENLELAGAIEAGMLAQSVVHQAAGMLSEQLGVSLIEALVRLRAHATTTGLPLQVVGRSIVAGQLTLER